MTTMRTGLTAVWVALHTLQYGLAISGLNGISDALTCAAGDASKGWLKDCVAMTPSQYGLVVSIFTLGGLVGCLLCDRVTRSIGRIGTLRVSAGTIFLGSAAVGLANTFIAMILGRILIGLGCGLATVTVPIFLAEIAPPAIKKSLGIMCQLFIVIGMLIAQSLSFPWAKPMIWRYVLAVSMAVSVVQIAGSFFVEEVEVEEEEEEPLSIRQLLSSKDSKIRRGLLVVVVTQLSQQLCGISPVMYFSTRILKPVFPGNSRLIALLIICFKIPLTVVPAFLIERVGSRPILLFSALFMSLSALLLAYGLNADSGPASVIAILSFVASFSVGLGPVTWVVLSEVMPTEATTATGAIGIGLNWSANFVMGSSFLPLQQVFKGSGDIFYLVAGMCALVFIAVRTSYGVYDRIAI